MKHNKTQKLRINSREKSNPASKTKRFHALNCSPSSEKNSPEYSCFSNNAIMEIGRKWNMRHPGSKIKLDNPRNVWLHLRNQMRESCHTESCWIRKHLSNAFPELRELINHSFSPVAPESWRNNPIEWLTTDDINKVMKQYEKAYKCFRFYGPSPINYSQILEDGMCVWPELCDLNIRELMKEGIFKIGFVFNTHPHYKEGEHWISMFVNLRERYIFFMDSNGHLPPKQVRKLIANIKKQCKTLKIPIKVIYNKTEHQKKNTECGIYSLFTIINLLTGKMYPTDLTKERIPDEKMIELRNKYFNSHL